jgi:AcrR family transcriptional regulator
MATPKTDKPMRADARENRARLMAAAVELFAERGTDVSLDAVAKRAGVGIGTLYRHFPTRAALVADTYRHEVDALVEAVPALLAEHPADVALELWMERYVSYGMTKRGMKDALRSVSGAESGLYAETRERILAAVGELLGAAVAAGAVRADVGADDVLRAMSAVWGITDDAAWPEQPRLLLALLMDGLRHGAPRA